MQPAPQDDELLFTQDDYDPSEQLITRRWPVLIVDDAPEVHSVTKLALNDLVVFDGELEFFHAYSGQEAKEFMSTNPNIAIILLDVVMETEDAGLKVVQYIRDELKFHEVRIILRTGQPGFAPEDKIITHYDINDYKTKTELTRSKLVATMVSALRNYQQIKTVKDQKEGLQKVMQYGEELSEQSSPTQFTNRALQHVNQLLGFDTASLIVAKNKNTALSELEVICGTQQFELNQGQKIAEIKNAALIQYVQQAAQKEQHVFEQEHTALYIYGVSQTIIIYLQNGQSNYNETQKQLLEVYLNHFSTALDNINLLNQLKSAAYIDSLTGLANRTAFAEQLSELNNQSHSGTFVAIVDLDHFSEINDGLSQEIGNQLLIAVAQRLSVHFQEPNKLARISADVFGLIGHEDSINSDRIFQIFEQSFHVGEHILPISCKIGICDASVELTEGASLLKYAYIALNRAKKLSQSRVEYYTQDMQEQTAWRLNMIRQLRSDFNNGKLQLWYQPQFDLRSNKMIGMEALLRWPTDDGGFISPEIFIPLAEHSGLIVDIGLWVVEQACEQLNRIDKLIKENLRISVNVSMPQFRNPNFTVNIAQIISRLHITPSRFELEITESVIMDEPQMVIDTLNEIKQGGIQIAIDDFGTGFSSLSYLQQLPLDRIKVDRAFVNDLHNKNGLLIAEMIVNLGKGLGLATIAEGIETSKQAKSLIALGCQEVQGYHYARPMPSEKLEPFIVDHFSTGN